MSEPEPHWKVRVQRGGKWEYVLEGKKDLLNPPEPREFGVRYRAALEGAAQLLHGVEAVEIERQPPLEPAPATLSTISGIPVIGIPNDGDTLTIGTTVITFRVSQAEPTNPPPAGPPATP